MIYRHKLAECYPNVNSSFGGYRIFHVNFRQFLFWFVWQQYWRRHNNYSWFNMEHVFVTLWLWRLKKSYPYKNNFYRFGIFGTTNFNTYSWLAKGKKEFGMRRVQQWDWRGEQKRTLVRTYLNKLSSIKAMNGWNYVN